MSEEKKVLKVNPLDFTFNNNSGKSKNNNTQKKRPKQTTSDIKVKTTQKPKKSDTLKKRSILRMIRNQQQSRYDRLFEKPKENTEDKVETPQNKDFEEAQKYLQSLEEKQVIQNKLKHNSTLRRMPYENVDDMIQNRIQIEPEMRKPETVSLSSNITPILHTEQPKYGCLKNGNLPTYRNYMNKTTSNRPPISIDDRVIPESNETSLNMSETTPYTSLPHKEIKQRINDYQMKKFIQDAGEQKPMKLKKRKQKKTIKRHHKVGRSKYYSKIGVLISNRTIRANINNQKQQLKMVPIQDIRKYLITHGFIKVGSTAPNDVLRKMYESALLMCGEVKNHSTENLLYNFFNDNKDEN